MKFDMLYRLPENKGCAAFCRRTLCFLLLLASITWNGCDNPISKEPQLKQAWRKVLLQDAAKLAESIYPIQWDNMILVSQMVDDKKPTLYALNFKKGNVEWQHADTTAGASLYYNLKPAMLGNTIMLPMGRLKKGIDRRNGRIKWTFDCKGDAEQHLETIGKNAVLQTVNDWDARQSYIYRIDANNGAATLLHTIDWIDSAKVFVRTPVSINDTSLLFSSVTLHYKTNATQAKWHILSLKSKKIVRQGEAYPDNNYGYGITKQPILAGNKAILMAYDEVLCIDAQNGKELWRTALPRDMLTSVPLLSGNDIFCAAEDGFLYKLNLEDGSIIWKAAISGTPSRMLLCENHLFVIGGGDGVLYTFDAQNGNLIRKMYAPNHHYVPGEFYRRFIGTDCEERRLLLFDGRSFRAYSLR